MLTRDGCRARISRLLDRLDSRVEALLLARAEHVFYFSNYMSAPTNNHHRAPQYLLIERDGAATLVLDGRAAPEWEQWADAVVDGGWGVKSPAETRAARAAQAAVDLLRRRGYRTVGIESSHLNGTVAQAIAHPVDVEPQIEEMRQVKDPDELAVIHAAMRVGEAGHAAAHELLAPGMSEIDFYAQVVAHATMAAAQPLVMMCDFGSGPDMRGGPPTTRRIEAGDNVVLTCSPTSMDIAATSPTPSTRALSRRGSSGRLSRRPWKLCTPPSESSRRGFQRGKSLRRRTRCFARPIQPGVLRTTPDIRLVWSIPSRPISGRTSIPRSWRAWLSRSSRACTAARSTACGWSTTTW